MIVDGPGRSSGLTFTLPSRLPEANSGWRKVPFLNPFLEGPGRPSYSYGDSSRLERDSLLIPRLRRENQICCKCNVDQKESIKRYPVDVKK